MRLGIRVFLRLCRGLSPACLLMLAGCADGRVEVVDAVSGVAVQAEVRGLDGDRMLVRANGYETWSGPRAARVELAPLWQTRFAGERIVSPRPPPPPCMDCPGKRAR